MYVDRQETLMSDNESEKIEIFFCARDLTNLDVVSDTDSFLRVYLKETNKVRKKVLETKVYWNDLNPDFAQTLVTEFFFEVRQVIIVEVYHKDTSRDKLVGTVETSIGEIFGSKTKGLAKEILDKNSQRKGDMIFKCEKIERGNNHFSEFTVLTDNLRVGSFFLCFGENSAMFRIYKIKAGEQYLLYESEYRNGSSNRYNRVKINEKRLCNNNPEQPIMIRFYKESQISAPVLIGEATFSLQSLIEGHNSQELRRRDKNKLKGIVVFQGHKRYTKYEFTDYLVAGMQMALVTCIDFTGSNQNPTHPSSLHYCGFKQKSQYEEALEETCKIVMDYDTDKLVPVYGFGAKVRMPSFNTGPKVHHCFPLNGNTENPNLYQVEGIIEGYRGCMKDLDFAGPTLFAPLLKESMLICEQMKQESKEYMILLILTDGAIHDSEEVKDLLVKCGRLPLSVIIVGIGKEGDWGLMHDLDDDDCQMTDFQGNRTERDLVQFVEFSEHGNNGVELAREVLEELPRQVEEYHQLCGLTPEIYKN